MEEKEKKIDVNSLIEETPAETVDVTSLIDGGEKKNSVSQSTSKSPSVNTTSSSTNGESGQVLPQINESLNPPGVLNDGSRAETADQPKITVTPPANNLQTAPSYETTGEVNTTGGTSVNQGILGKVANKIGGSETVNALTAGIASAGGILARSVPYISDILNKTINTVVPLNLSNLPADMAERSNPIAKGFEDMAKTHSSEANKDYVDEAGKALDVTDYLDPTSKHFSVKMGLGKAMNDVTESLPTTIGMMATGDAPAVIGGIATAFSAGEKQNLLEQRDATIEQNKKLDAAGTPELKQPVMNMDDINNVSIINGGLEMATEKFFGNVKLAPLYKEMFTPGKEVLKKEFVDGAKKIIATATKKYLGNVSEEFSSEYVNQWAQNMAKIYVGGDTSVHPYEGAMNAGLIGAFSGGAVGSPILLQAAHQAAIAPSHAAEANKHLDNQNTAKEILSNPNSSPEERDAATNALDRSFKEEDKLTTDVLKKNSLIPETKKWEIGQILVKEKKAYDAIAQVNNSSVYTEEEKKNKVQFYKDEIAAHQKAIDDIYKENDKLVEGHEKATIDKDAVSDEHKDLLKESFAKAAEKLKLEKAEKDAKEKLKAEKLSKNDKPKTVKTENTPEINTAPIEVRHSEDHETKEGIVSGTSDPALTKEGKEKATELGAKIEKKGGAETVVTSDTKRGEQTGEAIAKETGAKVETNPKLNPWDVGEWHGATDEEFNKAEKYFAAHPDAKEFEGKKIGESLNEYAKRVISERAALEEQHDEKTIVVAHGAHLRLWDAVKEADGWNEKARKLFTEKKSIEPATINNKENETTREKSIGGNQEESNGKTGKENAGGKTINIRKERAKEKIKNPDFLRALSHNTVSPHHKVLQYFIGGGRISPSAMQEMYGNKTDDLTKRNPKVQAEFNSRFQLFSKDARGIKRLAEYLSDKDTDSRHDDTHYREAIEDVLNKHNSRSKMADELNKAFDEKNEHKIDKEQEEYLKWLNEKGLEAIGEEPFDEAIIALEHLTDDEFQKLADDDKAFNEWFAKQPDIISAIEQNVNNEIDTEEEFNLPVRTQEQIDRLKAEIAGEEPTGETTHTQEAFKEETDEEPVGTNDKEAVEKLKNDYNALYSVKDVEKKLQAVLGRIKEYVKEGKITTKKAELERKRFVERALARTESDAKTRKTLKKIAEAINGGNSDVIKNSFVPGMNKVVDELCAHIAEVIIEARRYGYGAKEAIDFAMAHVKESKLYKDLVRLGDIDDKTFATDFKKQYNEQTNKVEAEKVEEDKRQQTVTNGKPDIYGEQREYAVVKRLKGNEKVKKIFDFFKNEDLKYNSISSKKATAYVNKLLDEYEANNSLLELAQALIDGKSPTPEELDYKIAVRLTDKLRIKAEQETNEFLRDAAFNKAANLAMWWGKEANLGGKKIGIAADDIANMLPSSKDGLRVFAAKEMETLHDRLLTDEQKSEIDKASAEINSLINEDNLSDKDLVLLSELVDKKIKEISDKIHGKEKADKINEFENELTEDLSPC